MHFVFANYVLDPNRRELRLGSKPIAVEPQVFDVLLYLLQNRDRLVSKDELIASVWGGRIVSDSNLTGRINAARRAIGDSGEDQKLIRTIPRKGFRFVASSLQNQRATARNLLPLSRHTGPVSCASSVSETWPSNYRSATFYQHEW